jgi:hypothetical protein
MGGMAGRECYHCKQWIEEGQAHDCWTTTEAALTKDLSEDLRDAWERIRETAADFGVQRIYASLNSIMFSRRSCYFFVRPKKTFLEVCIFLGRTVKAPQVRRVEPASRVKNVHVLRITHRDEVEPPVTDWLREAYDFAGLPPAAAAKTANVEAASRTSRTARTRKVTAETIKTEAVTTAAARATPARAKSRKAGARDATTRAAGTRKLNARRAMGGGTTRKT